VSVAAFDPVAAGYDAAFTDRLLGRWLRDAVRERLAFSPGDHVLELGCGTGEDAVWLAERGVRVTATDASPAMLAAAEAKAVRGGVGDRVSVAQLDLAAIDTSFGPLDGAFSNFGALNCLADLRPLAQALAGWVRPGARVVLVLMGPVCAWEIVWHLAHWRPRSAFRRLRRGAPAHVGGGATARVWYPSPRRLRAELEPWFRHEETVGMGVLLPPSYLADLVERRPLAFQRLGVLDRLLGSRVPWVADHYVAVFERR
jgi:SAM-dependent methyltransferase